jgi:hypothetical protein
MFKKVWSFEISQNMVKHLDVDNELGAFFSALDDAIDEICEQYGVEPWEFREEE